MKELALKIYALAQELILNPKYFWDSRPALNEDYKELIRNLLYPLAIAASASVFLGEFFRSDYFRIWLGLLWVIREMLLFGVVYYMGVYGTNRILKYFKAEQQEKNLQILVIYSMLPFLLISVVTGLFSFLRYFDIFGIYSFYIFWIGSKKFLKIPLEKQDNLVIRISLANLIVFVLLSFLSSNLLMKLD